MPRQQHPTPSFRDTIINLRRSISRRHAIYGIISKTWVKMRNVDNCCGDYGAPGC